VFGEMSLITGEKRSADVVAVGNMEVLKIYEKSLERVRSRFPKIAAKLFYNLSAVLSRRLRENTEIWAGEQVGFPGHRR